MTIRLILSLGCMSGMMLATPAAFAREKAGLSISGQLRGRVEAIDGQFRPNAPTSDAVLLLQTDIAAEYRGDGWRVGGELIDARGYFERDWSAIGTGDVNAVEPVQAYIGADLTDTLSATAGRFTMALGNGRLIARNNFRNTTNAFTGARADWHHDKASLLLFWTMPQRRLPSDSAGVQDNAVEFDKEGTAQQFFGGYAVIPLGGSDTLDLYSLRLVEHDAPEFATRDRRLLTTGFRFRRPPKRGDGDAEIEAAWQTGTTRRSSAPGDQSTVGVTAWLLHAEAGWTFTTSWQPRVALLFDYASGDDGTGRYGRFDALFGARVADFGPTSFYGPLGPANILSPAFRVEAVPGKNWDLTATARLMRLDSAGDSFANTNIRDPLGQSGKEGGTQIDARLRYWLIPKKTRLAMGAAWLAKGRFLQTAPNAADSGDTRYGYAEITFSL